LIKVIQNQAGPAPTPHRGCTTWIRQHICGYSRTN